MEVLSDHCSAPVRWSPGDTGFLAFSDNHVAELHRRQSRKGKAVPYISHLISVSAMAWDDAGVSAEQIAARCGERVASIVVDCTDTSGAVDPGGNKEPWLLRKTRYIASLEHKPVASLLVTAADKAHNARDMVLDARRDPAMWSRFTAGLEGSALYLLRMYQCLSRSLPRSRSAESLGESVQEILASAPYRACVPEGLAAAVWAEGYAERSSAPHA